MKATSHDSWVSPCFDSYDVLSRRVHEDCRKGGESVVRSLFELEMIATILIVV